MHTGVLNGHTCPQNPQLLLSLVGLTQTPEQRMSPGGQSVVDVVLADVVDVVVEPAADVVVVGAGHMPVARSQDSPEQQTVAAEHGLPVGVLQPPPVG